jgi:uncharacterized glyoxalase superfamily protein PhnB
VRECLEGACVASHRDRPSPAHREPQEHGGRSVRSRRACDDERLARCEPAAQQSAEGIREREHLLSASITVETAAEIKNLFLEFQASGVHFSQALKKEPWGARTFIIIDPDGNLVLFAGPAE